MAYAFVSLLTFYLVGCGVNGEISFKKGAPQVNLDGQGVISGIVEFSRDGRPFNSFKGIKYGEFPERFAESILSKGRWDGVKEMDKFGSMCTQWAFVPKPDGSMTVGEEDCLFLNVHVPMSTPKSKDDLKKGYPVMFWIHGGGFMAGDGHSFGHHFFMDEPVIIVSINYRLGVFGFLSTGDEIAPGNLGLKDMVVGLKWVRKNIKNFGGDAGKVTIFGESAGAGAVHYLLLSPLAKGLFHRAISQSGSALDNWAYHPSPKNVADDLATHMKCDGTSSHEILSCFKAASTSELNEAQIAFRADKLWPKMGMPGINFVPTDDPDSSNPFLSKSPFTILTGNEELANIPWIIGFTEEECGGVAGMVLNNQSNIEELNSRWDELLPLIFNFHEQVAVEEQTEVAKKIKEFYLYKENLTSENKEKMVNAYSDYMFNYGIYKGALETVRRKDKVGNVYLYQLSHLPPVNLMGLLMPGAEELKKAAHADDLTFLFEMKDLLKDFGVTEEVIKPGSIHEEFSKNFVKLWASFAKTGKPSHTWGTEEKREWSPINTGLKLYKIDSNPTHIKDPFRARMQFWDRLYKDHYNKILMKGQGSEKKDEL